LEGSQNKGINKVKMKRRVLKHNPFNQSNPRNSRDTPSFHLTVKFENNFDKIGRLPRSAPPCILPKS